MGRLSCRVSDGALGRNLLGINTDPVEPAKQLRMFDFDAAVHHRIKPSRACQLVGFEIFHADLLPQAVGTDLDCLLRDWQHVPGFAKYVNYFDSKGNIAQVGIADFTQYLPVACSITRA